MCKVGLAKPVFVAPAEADQLEIGDKATQLRQLSIFIRLSIFIWLMWLSIFIWLSYATARLN